MSHHAFLCVSLVLALMVESTHGSSGVNGSEQVGHVLGLAVLAGVAPLLQTTPGPVIATLCVAYSETVARMLNIIASPVRTSK